MLASDYVLLLSDPHHAHGVKQHPHDQLDHDQTPKHVSHLIMMLKTIPLSNSILVINIRIVFWAQ